MAMGIRKVSGDSDNVYDTEWYREQAAIAKRQNREHVAKYERSFNGIMAKADADGDEDDDDRDDGGNTDHPIAQLATLLVASGKFPDHAQALDHLLNTPRGVALVRTHKAAKDPPMDTVHSIMKDCGGPVAFAKTICDTGRSYGVSESEYVESASRHAGEMYGLPSDRAFAKLCESDGSVMRACGVLKAAEFSVFDLVPVVVGGPDAMNEANDDDDSAVLRAHEEIVRIAREKFPFLPADVAFARIFEDRNYAALAAQAHSRPQPTTIYRMPGGTGSGRGAYTKADPAPNADTAYSELMLKAEAYRDAHPELSVAQSFEKIYTDRANVELAKRERVESAPR
jgi:hypothetical protein